MIRFATILGLSVFLLATATRIQNFSQYCVNVNEDSENYLCQAFDLSTFDQVEFDSTPGSNADLVRFENCNLRRFPLNFFEKFRWVVTLKINSCNLKTIAAPRNVEHLENLERLLELNFNNNILDSIPSDYFDAFTALRKFDVSQNLLTVVKRETFKNATALRNLYMEKNKIAVLEDGAFDNLVYLYSLDLSSNLIEKLSPKLFRYNSALQSLQLQKNRILHLDESVFASLVNLEHLNLSENPLVGQRYTSTLFNMPKLALLFLSGVRVSLNADMFQNLRKLIHLDVSNNSLTEVNLDILHALPSLRELIINDNRLTQLNYKDERIFNTGFEVQLHNNPWNCSYLGEMVHYFREKSIHYYPLGKKDAVGTKTPRVSGISCTPDQGGDFVVYDEDFEDEGKHGSALLVTAVVVLVLLVVILGAGLAAVVFRPAFIFSRLRGTGNSGSGVTEIHNVNYQ